MAYKTWNWTLKKWGNFTFNKDVLAAKNIGTVLTEVFLVCNKKEEPQVKFYYKVQNILINH